MASTSGAFVFPNGIFLGPLRQGDNTGAKTARNLHRLMSSLGVRHSDIGRIVVEPEEGIALVELYSREAVDFMVRACKDVREVMNFFDLRILTNKPRQFRVMRQSSRRALQQMEKESFMQLRTEDAINKAVGTSMSDAPITHRISDNPTALTSEEKSRPPMDSNTWTKSLDESSSSTFQLGFEPLEEEAPLPTYLHASTSMSGSHVVPVTSTSPVTRPRVVKVDVKTSTPHVSPCFCPETVFYHMKQHVGSENRHVEFKRGGNVSDLRAFRSLLGKYMCAFLNTEGGTIFFGVTDDGKVVGIEANQRQEDMIRLNIDNVVTMIKPFLEPAHYSVNFAKVMNEDGTIADELKVLEICIKPRDPPRQKFTFNEVAYVRRDGSLRTL